MQEIVIEKITDDSENIEFDPANAYVVQEVSAFKIPV